jgi:formate hydrogenlyase transcriptional activator
MSFHAVRENPPSFESLISHLADRLLRAPLGMLDGEIEAALREIGKFFDADRCGLLAVQSDRKSVRISHAWYAEGLECVRTETNLAELFPWCYEKLIKQGDWVAFSSLSETPPEAAVDRKGWNGCGVKSALLMPLVTGEQMWRIGILQTLHQERDWPEECFMGFRLFGEICAYTLERRKVEQSLSIQQNHVEEQLRHTKEKLKLARDQMRQAKIGMGEQFSADSDEALIIGESRRARDMLSNARRVAGTDSAVLITGETGTGKELLAEAIHEMSARSGNQMIKVNCAALPSTLIESELFGREKGAYTGAMTQQVGRFELAHDSTLFLDEIGELSSELQVKLLRILQEGQFERVGGRRTLKVNVRIIAATNRNLAAMVKEGKFRLDLFYRLNVFPIEAPPLRERSEDIPLLTWRFLRYFSQKTSKPIDSISDATMETLQAYSWPGNIRELRNLIERAVIMSDTKVLCVDFPSAEMELTAGPSTLADMERHLIVEVLQRTGWRVGGKTGAAVQLGVLRTTLQSKMKKLGIYRPVV